MAAGQLPPRETWLAEIEGLGDSETRLREMQAEAKAAGCCASLQTHDGLPCRRSPRFGYPVCRKHGERAPQTIKKAERALATARMPAIEWIMDALDHANEETCDTCGFPRHGLKERKRIDQLAFKLLDRTGLGPRATLDINPAGNEVVDVSAFNEEEMVVLDRLLQDMEELKTRVRARVARQAAEQMLLAPQPVALLHSSPSSPDSGRE